LNLLYFIVDKVTSKKVLVRYITLSQEPKYFLVSNNIILSEGTELLKVSLQVSFHWEYLRKYIIIFCIKDTLSENFNYNKLSRVLSKRQLLCKIDTNVIPNADQFRNCCTVAVVRSSMYKPTKIFKF
jgi:hypothetical protein